MTSFLLKAIICPLVLILSDGMSEQIRYSHIGQAIVLGLILAAAGTLMEYFLLREGTLWISVAADFAVTVIALYYITNMFEGSSMTFAAAIVVSLILAATEILIHLGLIRTGRVPQGNSDSRI